MNDAQQVVVLKDLQADLKHVVNFKIPFVLLLSRSDCHFCHELRQNYLIPLVRESGDRRYLIRELQTDKVNTVFGVDGKTMPVNALLRQLNVNFFPTLLFLGSHLQMLAEPLIGLSRSGFYNAYLEQRLAMATDTAKGM